MFPIRCGHPECMTIGEYFSAEEDGWQETEHDFFCPVHKKRSRLSLAIEKISKLAGKLREMI